MDQVKAIRNKRKGVRASFTKICKKLDAAFDSNSEEDIHVYFEQLKNRSECLKQLNSEICDLLTEDDGSLEQEYEEIDRTEETFLRYSFIISSRSKTESSNNEPIMGSDVVNTGKRTFKLPAFYIKPFSGQAQAWLPFWNQFQRIHIDTTISDCDKFALLLQSIQEGSRARELVESYPFSAANYSKVIESLKNRFGREDVLIEVYVRQLLSLVIENSSNSNISLSTLYDKLECQLRALESLGVTSDKCASILFPMVESCLPVDILRAWQRSNRFQEAEIGSSQQFRPDSAQDHLESLMSFIRAEVETEESIAIAVNGFGQTDSKKKLKPQLPKTFPSTASGLNNLTDKETLANCIFCSLKHSTREICEKARLMSYEDKRKALMKAGCCYLCTKKYHLAKQCKVRLKCGTCNGRHAEIVCPGKLNKRTVSEPVKEISLSNQTRNTVFLQTLALWLNGSEGRYKVRALIDTGSHRSYISRNAVNKIKYLSVGTEELIHSLFGGIEGPPQTHYLYNVRLLSDDGSYACNFKALDQKVITQHISSVPKGPWHEELAQHGIFLSDTVDGPIDILIGADIAGKIMTGERLTLTSGLVALKTTLGWTLMGKTSNASSNLVCSLLAVNPPISDLWALDVLGIRDPAEQKSKQHLHEEVQKFFDKTLSVTKEGRYQVCLPWLEGHPPLPTNHNIAVKRTLSTIKRLKSEGYFDAYDQLLKEWEIGGIIEKTPLESSDKAGHFLPHRHVLKLNSTTPVRPVYDASSKERGSPSLNDCLATGGNLIELIPSLLIRFRLFQIGVSADIKRAFLQIELAEPDREFLKFFWVDSEGNLVSFRHKRVVFGVTCSLFLLGAVILHHLKKEKEKTSKNISNYSECVVVKMIKSFYVDNCLTSVHNMPELEAFISESKKLMAEACFDLRGWEYSYMNSEEPTPLLGLMWNKEEDTLLINTTKTCQFNQDTIITKRTMLSVAQRIFDPIGFSCPLTLLPKLLLQEAWSQRISWDVPLEGCIKNRFLQWCEELDYLKEVHLPRWLNYTSTNRSFSVHTFCDASGLAYAATVFIRVETEEGVHVKLVSAKNRVAPIKQVSIPRLELLAATIGARLGSSVIKVMSEELNQNINVYFWTDSTTVLSWILKDQHLGIFVRNRVQEINLITEKTTWNHIPGQFNPADLLSRGCSAKQLIQSQWWEGPSWLLLPLSQWPVETDLVFDENEISKEKLKNVTVSCLAKPSTCFLESLSYFSSYSKILRMIGWCFRFRNNTRTSLPKVAGELTAREVDNAELALIKIIQKETFPSGVEDENIKSLLPFVDEEGLIRIRTKVSQRPDAIDFRFPILLSSNQNFVKRLILEKHTRHCHAGIQALMTILRERYWIIGGRRAIKSVLHKCVPCLRYDAKHLEAVAVSLPINRVRDAAPFEITGIDYAGPLFLKNGEKSYICLFTCAIFRAVHLELVSSLTTAGFIQALRRFIARRGRPSTIYTDNGTNFVGLENALKTVDWSEIKRHGSIERIQWIFLPPASPWWGGWWERIVGLLKRLLRRTLGHVRLSFEDLTTVLCDCEAVLNERPLTYVSNFNEDLVPLTPSLFLKENVGVGVPDLDTVDRTYLEERYKRRLKFSEDLRQRFRSEYLGMLRQPVKKRDLRKVDVGDVVVVSCDNVKRMDWPLALVEELLPGRDGEVRLVRLRTATGQILRPIQRLFPLEISSKIEKNSLMKHENVDKLIHEEDTPLHCNATDPDETIQDEENSTISPKRFDNNYSKRGRQIKLPLRFLD